MKKDGGRERRHAHTVPETTKVPTINKGSYLAGGIVASHIPGQDLAPLQASQCGALPYAGKAEHKLLPAKACCWQLFAEKTMRNCQRHQKFDVAHGRV
jgi:hypothetical protein